MNQNIEIIYEVLDKKLHDRNDFFCQEEALMNFISKSANKGQKERNSTTHVAVELNAEAPKLILGFYTLTHTLIPYDILPDTNLVKPKHAINFIAEKDVLISIKIARLARNELYTSLPLN